jgi:tellurite resistance protein
MCIVFRTCSVVMYLTIDPCHPDFALISPAASGYNPSLGDAMKNTLLMKDRVFTWLLARPWIGPLLGALCVLLGASVAFARSGGGENYSGGGSGGGGGGDELGMLLWLVFAYPEVGVPVVIIVGIAAVVKRAKNPDRTTGRAVDRLQMMPTFDSSALGRIKERDPAWDEPRFVEKVKRLHATLGDAWCRGNMASVRHLLSDGLTRRFETQLSIMKKQGRKDAVADDHITALRIHAAEMDESFDTLHVLIRAEARDTDVDAALSYEEAKAKAAKAPLKPYEEVWSFLRRPGAKTKTDGALAEGKCPSCGAPLPLSQVTRCDSCKALVNSGEYDWVLAEITQVQEWRPSSSGRVRGFDAMRNHDQGCSRQGCEDRASYVFWRWVEGLVSASGKPLSKVATKTFRKQVEEMVASGPANLFKVAVGAVDLVACQRECNDGKDRVYTKVLWSCARSASGAPAPSANLFILERSTGARDQAGLSFARCPNCQGPLGENDDPKCEYCGEDLSAGARDWVLGEVIHPEELQSCLSRYAKREATITDDTQEMPGMYLPDMGNPAERVLLLMRIAAVIVADGVITKEENKLLTSMAKRWRIPLEAVEPILQGKETQVALALRPTDSKAFLSVLISAALVDGKVDKKEEKVLIDVGQSLGLGAEQVRNRVREMMAA